jgi:hypothetical protein
MPEDAKFNAIKAAYERYQTDADRLRFLWGVLGGVNDDLSLESVQQAIEFSNAGVAVVRRFAPSTATFGHAVGEGEGL